MRGQGLADPSIIGWCGGHASIRSRDQLPRSSALNKDFTAPIRATPDWPLSFFVTCARLRLSCLAAGRFSRGCRKADLRRRYKKSRPRRARLASVVGSVLGLFYPRPLVELRERTLSSRGPNTRSHGLERPPSRGKPRGGKRSPAGPPGGPQCVPLGTLTPPGVNGISARPVSHTMTGGSDFYLLYFLIPLRSLGHGTRKGTVPAGTRADSVLPHYDAVPFHNRIQGIRNAHRLDDKSVSRIRICGSEI